MREKKKKGLGEKGIALFLVLWILALLSVIVGEFCHVMRTEADITRNFLEETEAYYIARAGFNIALSKLINNLANPKKKIKAENITETEEPDPWRINADMPPFAFGNGAFVVRIENESGKIHINKVENRQLLKLMLNCAELDENEKESIVDAIFDWRDKDNLHRLNGAENDYYKSLPEPYACKNGPFDSIEELGLVKGITPEIFRKIKPLVTIYPSGKKKDIKNRRSQGRRNNQRGKNQKKNNQNNNQKKKLHNYNRLNINALSKEMLSCFPDLTEEMIREILLFREEKDFSSPGEFSGIVGPEVFEPVSPFLGISSVPYYRIEVTGKMTDSPVRYDLSSLVKLDGKLKKKYRVIVWKDGLFASVTPDPGKKEMVIVSR